MIAPYNNIITRICTNTSLVERLLHVICTTNIAAPKQSYQLGGCRLGWCQIMAETPSLQHTSQVAHQDGWHLSVISVPYSPPRMRCQSMERLPSRLNLKVPIFTPGWREAHTCIMRVLEPGFWGTPTARKTRRRITNDPSQEPSLYMCVILPQNYFLLKECDAYIKTWLLRIFQEMFLKCFRDQFRKKRIKGSEPPSDPGEA